MDVASKENINKNIVALNNAIDETDLTDICRTFHPKEAKYTFLSNAHGTFSKIDHMIGHKTSFNKFKKIEIISGIFSVHKGLKLETNIKEKKNKTLKNKEIDSEGLEKIFQINGQEKMGWCSNIHIKQNKLQKKGYKKETQRTLHNTQMKNPSKGHKHYKHICTQHISTQIYQKNLGELQERCGQQHNYSRGF